jgi:hypothetical protein
MADAAFTLAWQSFHLPKQGHTLAEYEDAFAGDPEKGRFAVADGASESAFAGIWARILVKGFVQVSGSWSDWLPAARKRWRTKIEGRELPWYAESKFNEGAFATLLGVSFEKDRWQAEAMGDSCLFQVRGQECRVSFPLQQASEFGNRPHLLGSRARGTTQLRTKRQHLQADWHPGDILFLMTDALAQWFLSRLEQRLQPWKDWQDLGTPEQFTAWVDRTRRTGELRNDDVTLLRIYEQNRP